MDTKIFIIALVTLLIGAAGGYYYGDLAGRAALLAEQEAEDKAAQEEAQAELAEAANPFETANPFESGYENPFKAQTNPFAQ